ncbi:hypothetical protein BZA05DRAFT_208713 [Tricharina praecox]|uniref:uncharacterized protein n=1 Tax=Tricharina praecox TaxID=43433 RepID=UPI002220ACD3|nr:uncharacterized protein BZA05DRAFT_208713 [Tricharina praecox]KAI5842037.1 hypothetical protein BZA05DRAFT_208713 [Tricharina praecox]
MKTWGSVTPHRNGNTATNYHTNADSIRNLRTRSLEPWNLQVQCRRRTVLSEQLIVVDRSGLGIAVVGLAGQLVKASVEGYNLLSTIQSFGREYADLSHRIDTEKRWLEKWADVWVLESNRKIDPSHCDFRFAVSTLARISAVFLELLEYSSKYGLQYDRQRKRDSVRQLFRLPSRTSPIPSHRPTDGPGTQTGLDQDSIKLLTNPTLLSLGRIMPGLEDEVKDLKRSAERLQKTLPTMKKLQWSLLGRNRVEDLIGQLKEYNESLQRILPVGPQPRDLSHRRKESATPSFAVNPILPFHRDRMFCGRADIIDTIHAFLNEGASADARQMARGSVVLYGLGGIGKSSIALEYSFRYSDSYTTVFWIDVTNGASLSQSARGIVEHIVAAYAERGSSYEHIASMLGLRGFLGLDGEVSSEAAAGQVTGALKKWLATKGNENWLLILDNYDDVDAVDIHLVLPTCDTGNVIITSRKSDLKMLGIPVAVDDIDKYSGMELFMKSANIDDVKAEGKHQKLDIANQIAVKLGFLPLALTQAGSYISYTQIPLQRYLALLDGAFRTFAQKGGPEWLSDQRNSNRTIFTTWEISFASLSHPAQELLLLCGFLAHADIPDKLFEGCQLLFDWAGEGEEWLLESRAELFRISLARRNGSRDAFWIHPVVHLWARERLDARSQQTKAQEALILCGRISKDYNAKSRQDWDFERRVWSHMDTVRRSIIRTEPTTPIMVNAALVFYSAAQLGRIYASHRLDKPVANLFEWSLAGQEELLGKDHPDTLSTVNYMADVFSYQSEYDKALEWYQRALDGREKSLGNDHPDTLTTVDNMAGVFRSQGQYEKALEWRQRALVGREKSLGKDHPDTLNIVNNIADVFSSQGQYDKALEWNQRAHDGYEKLLGKDHPATLTTVHNIAHIFTSQCEYDKAQEWYQRALDGYEKSLGKEHPITLTTVNSIAGVFSFQGQYEKALEWNQRALVGREKSQGKNHRNTLTTVNDIASVFGSQGEYDKALVWYQRALDGYEKSLGKDHPDTFTIVNNMAHIFTSQCEYDKSLEWYQRALDGREKSLGNDHPDTLTTVDNMAQVFRFQYEYDKALEWCQRALVGREKSLGKNHCNTLNTVHNIAHIFTSQCEYDKALEWYQRTLDGYEKSLGKDHRATLTTIHNIAHIFTSQCEYDKALEWYQRALDGYEKLLGKEHPITLTTVNSMAGVFSSQGQYDKALAWNQRALVGREKTLGEVHPDTLTTVNNIAAMFSSQGQYDKALEFFQRALDGGEKSQGKDHPDTLTIVANMAHVFGLQGEYDKALEWYQRALKGREKLLGRGHPDTLRTAQAVVALLPHIYSSQGPLGAKS